MLTILATALRAAGAVLFMIAAQHLGVWSWYYIGANAVSLIIAFGFFYPRQRLRLRTELYVRRLPNSIYVAGAEVLFYLQMEFDKLLVLAIGGPHLAGIYAIIMRLVDLTAIPIRTFSMMLVQQMMRAPELLSRLAVKSGIEGGVFLVSTLALAALGIVLHFFPNALGRNVAEAAPLVALAICVPDFATWSNTRPSCCSRAARRWCGRSTWPAGRAEGGAVGLVLAAIADTRQSGAVAQHGVPAALSRVGLCSPIRRCAGRRRQSEA